MCPSFVLLITFVAAQILLQKYLVSLLGVLRQKLELRLQMTDVDVIAVLTFLGLPIEVAQRQGSSSFFVHSPIDTVGPPLPPSLPPSFITSSLKSEARDEVLKVVDELSQLNVSVRHRASALDRAGQGGGSHAGPLGVNRRAVNGGGNVARHAVREGGEEVMEDPCGGGGGRLATLKGPQEAATAPSQMYSLRKYDDQTLSQTDHLESEMKGDDHLPVEVDQGELAQLEEVGDCRGHEAWEAEMEQRRREREEEERLLNEQLSHLNALKSNSIALLACPGEQGVAHPQLDERPSLPPLDGTPEQGSDGNREQGTALPSPAGLPSLSPLDGTRAQASALGAQV